MILPYEKLHDLSHLYGKLATKYWRIWRNLWQFSGWLGWNRGNGVIGMSAAKIAKSISKPHVFFTTKAQRKKRKNQSVVHHVDSENSSDSSDSESFCDSAAVADRKRRRRWRRSKPHAFFTTKAQRKKRKSHVSSIEQMSEQSSCKMV